MEQTGWDKNLQQVSDMLLALSLNVLGLSVGGYQTL